MNRFIKKCREEAGLTQEQLAEKMGVSTGAVQNWENGKTGMSMENISKLAVVLNIPAETIFREIMIEEDKKRLNRWPGFLFDEYTNRIVDSLHLNLAQQELFGLLYIYDAECLKYDQIGFDSLREDLKRIPYGLIEKNGSISFINRAEGLYRVIRYVQPDFLMKILKQNPDMEFDVRKLTKDQICEFIDHGHRELFDIADRFEDEKQFDGVDELHLDTSMEKAKIILPVLAESGVVLLSEGGSLSLINSNLPENVKNANLDMCGFKCELWEDGYYEKEYNAFYIRSGLEDVTDIYRENSSDPNAGWYWKINDTGRELLNWFNEKE